MIRNLLEKLKGFIRDNPGRAKFFGVLLILAIVPFTVIAALTVQNLRQHASQAGGVQIVHANGNQIQTTSDPNVYIKITLPQDWVAVSSVPLTKSNLVNKAYAASSSCNPPYEGFLGCFAKGNSPSGSACTGSCTAVDGSSGSYCYTSTTVGNTCTTNAGLPGTCSEQGSCIPSPTAAPTPTPLPNLQANCSVTIRYNSPRAGLHTIKSLSGPTEVNTTSSGNEPIQLHNLLPGLYRLLVCGVDSPQACPTFLMRAVCPALGAAPAPPQTTSSCKSDNDCIDANACTINACVAGVCQFNKAPVDTVCDHNPTTNQPNGWCNEEGTCALSMTNQLTPTETPTPTPAPQLLNALRIENKDNDGSSGGSKPINVTSNFGGYIPTPISWKLNELMPGQDQAIRVVQATLFSNSGASVTLSSSVTLVRPAPISYTVSPVPSLIPSISPLASHLANFNYDLNGDRVINCKDMKGLLSQYGKKGTNIFVDSNFDGMMGIKEVVREDGSPSADFNGDGIVDGIDYNILVRNYTPGDTTKCP